MKNDLLIKILEEIEKSGNKIHLRGARGYGASHPKREKKKMFFGVIDIDTATKPEDIAKPVQVSKVFDKDEEQDEE